MERTILLDTETTGFDPESGDRILEVAALELIEALPTGREFHAVIDPERDVPEDAARIHGFTTADVRGKPLFAAIAPELDAFLGDSPIIAHNAPFDFKFLDAERARLDLPPLGNDRMIDTLALARARFPGMPNSLDALCRRYDIDLSLRTSHNALLDCRLLAQVYVELIGGKQRGLDLSAMTARAAANYRFDPAARTRRLVAVSPAELAAHAALVSEFKDPVWSAG